MSERALYEAEKAEYLEQIEIVAQQLRDDPDNLELKILQDELNNCIALLDKSIAELNPKQAPQPAAQQPPPPPAEPEKWSKENHPAFKKSAPVEDKDDAPVNYQVNDTILAKWVSGDKAFYPARITSVTGSSTAPIYTVKFKGYDNTETLRSKDIRPVSNKRKAEGPPATTLPQTPAPPAPGVVSSAGATVYPDAMREAEQQAEVSKPKAKKIKAKRELEAGKNKWQEFSSKSKFSKVHKKDSMFRTPEGFHGRVGFTGSGQAMRKDATRSRHVYQVNEELD